MGKSVKKVGIIKDRGFKRCEYNRMFRRINKHRIKVGKAPLLMSEILNDYDVCDWVHVWLGDAEEREFINSFTDSDFDEYKRNYFSK